MIETALTIAKEILSEMAPRDFCGCYEGDLDDSYPEGVKDFLRKFEARLNQKENP